MSILIITTSGDTSTDFVMDWVSYLDEKSIRYNVDLDSLDSSCPVSFEYGMSHNDSELKIQNKTFSSNEIKAVWFRKFFIPKIDQYIRESTSNRVDISTIINHNEREFSSGMFAIFNSWLLNKQTLGSRIINQPSKMEMLIAAKKVGIEIPNTLITSEKSKLELFIKKNKKVVTKAIKNVELFVKKENNQKNIFASMYTELLDENLMKKIPNHFFISLFQEALDKEIEIRTFYLNGKTYSSAIFSQLDNQTNIDFRMYNFKNPNRTVPYKLPSILNTKVKELMNALGLKTGSIDFVKTQDGRTVFLEVNPWGQYGMVSGPCNYYLDEKIAKYLIKIKNEEL